MEVDYQAKSEVQTSGASGIVDMDFNVELLKIYYDKAFPYNEMFKWLSYNKFKKESRMLQSLEDDVESDYFHNREFSFTLENDVYCRYLCFKNALDFKETLVSRCPHKIDIGAVFNIAPKNHNQADKKVFIPLEKEMVFDIDMTDYDNVRTCCTGAKVCVKCWAYMACATQVINHVLTKDFGFSSLLWVFSGRRGIHCWIGDEQARQMTNEMRSAVTEYLFLPTANEMNNLDLSFPLHPMLEKAFNFLNKHFEQIVINDQDLLSHEAHQKKFIKILPLNLQDSVRFEWNKAHTGSEKWAAYKKIVDKYQSEKKQDQTMVRLVFTYLYPRIDANVSKGINHLLKSPFCVHPKTGKICVPFDPNQVFQFDIQNVATLAKVINDVGTSRDGKIECLEESMAVFRSFLRKLKTENIEEIRQIKKANEEKIEF
eukprot:403370832